LDTTVITAGAVAGSTVGYSTALRFRSLGRCFFGRVSVCPFVAFFRTCRAAFTVNVIGAPIVIAIASRRARARVRAPRWRRGAHACVLIHSRRRRVDAAPDVAFFRTIALASAITAPSRSRALKNQKTHPGPRSEGQDSSIAAPGRT
jgi:hypothetical protein